MVVDCFLGSKLRAFSNFSQLRTCCKVKDIAKFLEVLPLVLFGVISFCRDYRAGYTTCVHNFVNFQPWARDVEHIHCV
jgi:hypothetical protein